MNLSPKGLKLLMLWEGCRLRIYADAGGKPTIGVGHLLRPHENFSQGITTSQALDLLDIDIIAFEKDVTSHILKPLTQDQFDALVIFCYNIGQHGFDSSTVVKDLLKGDFDDVPRAMRMWNKVGGKICKGLVNRREKEILLWKGEI